MVECEFAQLKYHRPFLLQLGCAPPLRYQQPLSSSHSKHKRDATTSTGWDAGTLTCELRVRGCR